MKSVKVVFGLVCFFFATTLTVSSYPFDPVSEDTWSDYMSPPRYQRTDFTGLGNACYHIARVGCLEAIYNQFAGLNSTTKVRMHIDEYTYSAPYSTEESIDGYPNYNGNVTYDCDDNVSIDVYANTIKYWLKYTPVCVKIRTFDSNDYEDWDFEDGPINWEESDDDHHWMVCVGYSTKNGRDYYRFFNQWSVDFGDSGFIDIYDYDGDISRWFEDAEFPLIYDSYSINNYTIDQSSIHFSYVPRIFPAFFPNDYAIPSGSSVSGNVYIVGDFIISSPNDNNLSIATDTVVKFDTDQITANEGGYPTGNEIIVNGKTLTIGNNVTFQSIETSPSSGDWGQIKVYNGGTLTIGSNVTISDAVIGLHIESNNLNCPSWDGTSNYKSRVCNCRDWGALISSTATIRNIDFSVNGNTDTHGSLCVTSGSSGPTINYVTVDSTVYGVYVSNYSNMSLTNCKFENTIQRHMVFLVSSSSSLTLLNGYNNFYYIGDGTYHAVYNSGLYDLDVSYNHWNGAADAVLFENPSKIVNNYTRQNPYPDAGACKIVSTIVHNNPFRKAEELETNGELSAARDIYRQVLSTSDNPHDMSLAVKSLIRTYEIDPAVSDMHECSSVISEQISSAEGWYKELLEYLLCDLAVKEAQKERSMSTLSKEEREAQYRDSIAEAANQFVTRSDEYSGSPMQVEMLSRAAVLYGDYLDDKTKAKSLADRAASINPGQPILLTAYLSAGCEYDPWKYIDKYHDAEDIPDQPFESNSADGIDISLSPNPFNPSTVLTYSLNAPSHVKIAVYSINGQKVTELTDAYTSAGRHSVVFDGSKYASGVYFYRFTSSAGVKTGKMLLVK